ncbi:hypothetical protein BLNAU_13834 [Blattamonas nauphoetae]|uniref:Uncharacterized protein n=1 Tax=Blattamonas nauphoetae TaxID=2049346 RepID=A0ABQ9XFG6_9EUKA|nr:hypothetical protein BLNAU_13834 [Blattamonas nauphoetae]
MSLKEHSLSSSFAASLNCPQESHSIVKPEEEPFLKFDPNSLLSFEDKSRVYCSLVALVKEGFPFDNTLQYRAALFLGSLRPKWDEDELFVTKLVTDLVPSSPDSPSGFVESIVTLFSSRHSTLKFAALTFLLAVTKESSPQILYRLVGADLVANMFETVRPHTLPISRNEPMMTYLVRVIKCFLALAEPFTLRRIGITSAVDEHSHREMIFQKVVLPSSHFLAFLTSNQPLLSEHFSSSFMDALCQIIGIGPFHSPTLEFVLASPVVMAFSSCLSFVEDQTQIRSALGNLTYFLEEWTNKSPEMMECGKRMMQALFSENLEDALEQMMRSRKSGALAISGSKYGEIYLISSPKAIRNKLRWMPLSTPFHVISCASACFARMLCTDASTISNLLQTDKNDIIFSPRLSQRQCRSVPLLPLSSLKLFLLFVHSAFGARTLS